jgi:hypothetical protein
MVDIRIMNLSQILGSSMLNVEVVPFGVRICLFRRYRSNFFRPPMR